jgi:hypothetical protein
MVTYTKSKKRVKQAKKAKVENRSVKEVKAISEDVRNRWYSGISKSNRKTK